MKGQTGISSKKEMAKSRTNQDAHEAWLDELVEEKTQYQTLLLDVPLQKQSMTLWPWKVLWKTYLPNIPLTKKMLILSKGLIQYMCDDDIQ
jgi:hypothetical protein